MANLRPLRDYDEKDVINLYAFSGTLPVNKGTLVKVQGNGWTSADELEMIGSAGDLAPSNTVSQRYGVAAKVSLNGASDSAVGMTLFDVKETDENGEQLKFNPRKAAELQAVISGQAVPLVTRGIFLYDGITGTVTAGQTLYAAASGGIAQNGTVAVGKALGTKDASGYCLIKLSL